MINLLEANIDIEYAEKKHLEFFEYFIKRKLNINIDKFDKLLVNYEEVSNIEMSYIKAFQKFLLENNRLERIIKGEPIELLNLNKEFIVFVDRLFYPNTYFNYLRSDKDDRSQLTDIHDFFLTLDKIFNYDKFVSLQPNYVYSTYHLTKDLDVRACTYCNRTYTITHNTENLGKLMRPQLDHWFPKSRYPLLAISFYNLIPSCYHCNSSVKKDKVMKLEDHIHPYVKRNEKDDFVFSYIYDGSDKEYRVIINPIGSETKSKETLEFLKINEMYDAHQSEIDDLLKTEKEYSKQYLETLKSAFPDANLSEKEIYRLAFGVEMDRKDFHKRPFSKFKYDILKELGIIN